MFNAHIWIFASKYFQKGIEYTRFKANDALDKSLKLCLCVTVVAYEAYNVSVFAILGSKFPLFEPVYTQSDDECIIQFVEYS